MPERPIERQPPDVLALVLADTVLHELGSGKFFIQGTFSALFAADFPASHPVIAIYYAVTNGHGETEMKIRLVDAEETREPIFEVAGMMEFADPLQVLESVMVARGPVFPLPGEYRVQLWGAGQLVKERRLMVMPLPGSASAHEQGDE